MAVKDEHAQYPTENLILARTRKHYRIPVKSQHWQLRSLLSTEKQDVLYFPGGNGCNHVLRLNTKTQECETIKLLTFSPRCLVARNGWVCCGGETGEFTAIQIDEPPSPGDLDFQLNALDPDARLPLSLDSPRQDESIFSIISRTRRSNKSLIAKSERLAHERVNCITLWFPPKTGVADEAAYTEPVAVLANNDKTVTLVGLQNFGSGDRTEPLDVIKYPDYVNRAIISPDGRMLVSILDDPFLYVHVRGDSQAGRTGVRFSRRGTAPSWQPCRSILLRSQRKDDGSDSRGSFAACFSSSGAYLAIGTQYGTISVFDARALGNLTVDPLITSFKSTRPELGPGAIRDMAFSPAPYDLLAWTEDRAHIGVADLRDNFVSRQVLDINAEADFEHISILDRNTIDPRLLSDRSESAAGQALNPTSIYDPSLSRQTSDLLQIRPDIPLTPEETAVLEALQDERRRRDQRSQRALQRAERTEAASGTGSGSGSGTLTPWTERAAARRAAALDAALDADESPIRPARQRSSSVSRAFGIGAPSRERSISSSRLAVNDLMARVRDQHDRAQERVRSAQQLLREAQDRAAADQRRRGATGTAAGRLGSSAGGSGSGSGGWADLDVLFNLSREVPALSRDITGLRDALGARSREQWGALAREQREREREAQREWERDGGAGRLLPLLNHLYPREWDDLSSLRRHPGIFESPPQPDNTAGVAWSEDGRTLFVGAENGIYEFHVNVQARKFCPSINMR